MTSSQPITLSRMRLTCYAPHRFGNCATRQATTSHRPAAEKRKETDMQFWPLTLPGLVVAAGAVLGMPGAHADGDNNTLIPNNKRLNDSVVSNVYTMQHQAGCTNDVRINPQLQLAAERHTKDTLNNRGLDSDIGADGSRPQDRANAVGFHGLGAKTVAINPALAISGTELINQWYYNPAY